MSEGGVRFGSYELIRQIARGGMAQIFLAVEHGLEGVDRQVVVKRILPEMTVSEDFVTMFTDEARLVARLAHPNVAPIYGFGEVDGVYYLAMEYVDGVTVSRLIRKLAPDRIPLRIALRIAADMCAGLHYAHELRGRDDKLLGVIHRDVSPQNVIVSRTGVSKLIDFGVARAGTQVHVTRAQQLKGKLPYMAPELLHNLVPDRRIDVFAMGVVLHEMLSGVRLYKRESEAAIVSALLYEQPTIDLPVGVPAAVGPIVQKALAKDREQRYPTAEAMQHDIEMVIADNRLVATHYVVSQFITRWLAENPQIEGVPAVSVVEATGGSFSYRSSPSATSPPRPKPSEVPTAADLVVSAPVAAPPVESERLRRPDSSAVTGTLPSTVTPGPGSDLPAPRSSRRMFWAGIAAAMLGLSAFAGALYLYRNPVRPDEDRGGLAGLGSGGTPRAADAAAFPVDVRDAGRAEAGPRLVDAGRPDLPAKQAEADAGPAAAPDGAPDRPGDREDEGPAQPRGTGTLFLATEPWSRVQLGGTSLGTTPLVGVKVAAGSHRLRLVDADGKVHSLRVVVRPGEATKVFRRLGPGEP